MSGNTNYVEKMQFKYTKLTIEVDRWVIDVRNGLSPFHGIQANCIGAKERKGMWALEEVAPRMIKQCDI